MITWVCRKAEKTTPLSSSRNLSSAQCTAQAAPHGQGHPVGGVRRGGHRLDHQGRGAGPLRRGRADAGPEAARAYVFSNSEVERILFNSNFFP